MVLLLNSAMRYSPVTPEVDSWEEMYPSCKDDVDGVVVVLCIRALSAEACNLFIRSSNIDIDVQDAIGFLEKFCSDTRRSLIGRTLV